MEHQYSIKRGLVALALLLLLAGMGRSYQIAKSSSGIDFFHFWIAPHVVANWPDTDLYQTETHGAILLKTLELSRSQASPRIESWIHENQEIYASGLHPSGTPFLYFVHGWLRTGQVDIDYWMFQWGGTLLMVVGVYLLGVRLGLRGWQSIGIAGLLLILHRGVSSDIGMGNVNRLQIFVFGLAFWVSGCRSKCWGLVGMGVVLGLATAYKPNLLLAGGFPLLAMLSDRDWKSFAAYLSGLSGGVCSGVVLAAHMFGGVDCWFRWRTYVGQIWTQPFQLEHGNYALSRLFSDQALPQVSMSIAAGLCLGVLVVLWRYRAPVAGSYKMQQHARMRYGSIAAIGLVVPLMSGPVMWGHYCLLAVPLSLILMFAREGRATSDRRLGPAVWATIGLILTGLVPVTLVPNLGPTWVLISLQLGLGCLVVGGCWHLKRLATEIAVSQ